MPAQGGPQPLTWAGGTLLQTPANVSINSDPVDTDQTIAFSLIVTAAGTGAHGLTGNLEIIASNDGWLTDAIIATVTLELGSGDSEVIDFSQFASFAALKLQWTQAGIGNSGTLGIGEWDIVLSPSAPITPPSPPQIAVVNEGLVVASTDRLRQYLKTKPNVVAIIKSFANRFAEAGTAIQGIQAARNWATLASGTCTDMLNQIGKIVGAIRPLGAGDEQYVQYVRAQIAANHSSGSIEDLYTIASFILPPGIQMRITEFYPAAFIFHLTDPLGLLGPNGIGWKLPWVSAPGADGAGYVAPYGNGNSGSHSVDALAYFVRVARPTAVWAVISYEIAPDNTVFTLDIGPGLDVGLLRGWQA